MLLASLVLVACGSSKHHASTSSSAAPPSASAAMSSSPPSAASSGSGSASGASAAVTTAWETFFNGKTPAQQKIALLQNGQQFAAVIQAQAGSTLAQSSAAKVSKVVVNGSSAEVTYTIMLGGAPVLTNQQGQAVLEGSTWKVGDASFCALLALQSGGNTSSLPPACAAAVSGASSPAG